MAKVLPKKLFWESVISRMCELYNRDHEPDQQLFYNPKEPDLG